MRLFVWGMLFLILELPIYAQDLSFKMAFDLLNSLPSGHVLIRKLRIKLNLKRSNEILNYLYWDEVSKTNAVLARSLDLLSGKETRKKTLMIYLRRKQSIINLTLDLAHEFTHASGQDMLDPYDPNLTLGKYVLFSVEGRGGELEALTEECQVALELKNIYGFKFKRCEKYIDPSLQRVSIQEIKLDFYKVGGEKQKLLQLLGEEVAYFPFLSSEEPMLISATGNAPYPVALSHEYIDLNKSACNNTLKRLKNLGKNQGKTLQSAQSFIHQRCPVL